MTAPPPPDEALSANADSGEVPPSAIEPDPAPSSVNADSGGSTASLNTSIYNFPTENGRRYHKFREGSYMYPNDETENERLDLQYELYNMAFGGKRFFAPLEAPKKILDIGTGTGIWPIEMAETFPDCEIIGTDLSPIQPDWVPDNVRFIIDDASEDDWLYPPGSFDYVHTRVLLGCFEDFREIIKKSFKYIKPGGWMESQELFPNPQCDDETMKPEYPLLEWTKIMDDAAMNFGRPIRIANKLKKWYLEAGFEEVHEQVFKVPLNEWPREPHFKTMGRINELNMLQGLQGLSLASMYRVLGWTQNEIEVYLINVRKALSDREVHGYYKV
ncbi:MAG: hypothetical protein M1838_000656 [Thelocarpon superellum]|nr:MAG: hypothetical protein M1838_000656 [Thelocarpon superellum]